MNVPFTHYFVEVSGLILRVPRLEVSECISFLNHREGVWFSIMFPPFSFTETVRGCVSLKKQKSQGKAVAVIVNRKEENSSDFCLDFFQEFSLGEVTVLGVLEIKLQKILKDLYA
jgi:hypothetical protein